MAVAAVSTRPDRQLDKAQVQREREGWSSRALDEFMPVSRSSSRPSPVGHFRVS